MSVANTSRQAYQYVKPKLNGRRKQVYEAIKKLEPVENLRIAEYLGLPINQITGRVNELWKMGLVQVEMTAKNSNGKTAKFWSHKVWGEDRTTLFAMPEPEKKYNPEWS